MQNEKLSKSSFNLTSFYIFLGQLPDINSDDDVTIPCAQPEKHKRCHSPIPPDADIIEISDNEEEMQTAAAVTTGNVYVLIF